MNWLTIHRHVLAVYPQEFRERFGGEMEAVFEEGLTVAPRKGLYAVSALADLLRCGLAERFALVNPRSGIAALVCLAIGLLVGKIDSGASEPQGTVIVILLVSGFIGAIWRRGAVKLALLFGAGIPLMYGLLAFGQPHAPGGPMLFVFIPALVGVACGVGIRLALESEGSGPIGLLVAVVAGIVFGITRLLLDQTVILGACCALAGVSFGRSTPRAAYLWAATMVVCVLATEVAIGAGMRIPPPGVYYLQDLAGALLTFAGVFIGVRFKDDAARYIAEN